MQIQIITFNKFSPSTNAPDIIVLGITYYYYILGVHTYVKYN